MIEISTSVKSLLRRGGLLGVNIEITQGQTVTSLTGDDIVEGTLVVDRNRVSGSDLEIGNAESAELSFDLYNFDRSLDTAMLEKAVLTAKLIAGSEYIDIGKFIVDKVTKTGGIITVRALDFMCKFDVEYATSLGESATLLAILQDCCAQCEVILATTNFTSSTFVGKVPAEKTTFHQVVASVAELAGCNAWIDVDGQLHLSWYGQDQGTNTIEITADDVFAEAFEVNENDVTVTGVLYRTFDLDVLAGSELYCLVIENNPLVGSDGIETMLNALYAKLNGFKFRPYSGEILCRPDLWPGDVVSVVTDSGDSEASIITNHTFLLNQNSQIAAKGKSAAESERADYGSLTPAQKTVVKKVSREVMSVEGIDAVWIRTGTLSSDRIGAGSISAEKITTNTITSELIAAGAIQTDDLAAGAVTAVKIAVGAIVAGSAIIQDAAITTAKIANSAITNALIANEAVDTAQIANGSITDAKIVSMTANKITAGTIDAANINVINLNADNLTVGTINGQRIGEGSITTGKISSGAITSEKIALGSIKETQLNWSTHLLF